LALVEPTQAIDLPQGQVRYRDSGGQGRPIVFVHGLLVDGALWRQVTPALEQEHRCIVPDWPLGSHRTPLNASADRSPRGMAHLIADFLAALSLEEVTVVGNDTGGAISQLLVTERPERIARLVLTPCDAYENFLPAPFRPLQWLAHVPGGLVALAQPMRLAAVRRSPLGFGLLVKRPIPDEITWAWLAPSLHDPGVRRDLIGLLRAIDTRDTLGAAQKFGGFDRPVLIAWAREDLVFKLRYGERLAREFPRGRLEVIHDSRSFVPEDQPARLAELTGAFVRES
jgi:pimeloyl-ACP methyl ester carboxylesterase